MAAADAVPGSDAPRGELTPGEALERGRAASGRRAWGDAFTQLSAADRAAPLAPADLERLAAAAYLIGRDDESTRAWTRAHQLCLDRGDVARAVRCAFWIAFGLLDRGEHARGGGWIARATRLLDERAPDCVERGYLLLLAAQRQLEEGDPAAAHATFGLATDSARRFGDGDLLALARHGQGRALIRRGDAAAGVALLDEVMVAVTGDEVSPIVVGTVYCSVISACQEIFDVRRAQEWTAALTEWCDAQPDLVPFRGQCLVRRAELLRLGGAWRDALAEAARACARLSDPPGQAGLGAAFYQRAELHRLRGAFAEAEDAYREAHRCGRTPQPGLAQLRLSQGRLDDAVAAIRGAVDEARERRARSRLLGPYVEIMISAGELPAARAAAEELAAIAADLDAPFLRAASDEATGAALLAEGDAAGALDLLRRARAGWRTLGAPYEAARVRVLLARASRALGDRDTAELELDTAGQAFRRLGAAPDLAALRDEAGAGGRRGAGRLTTRETEVLRLVATGRTNRSVAAELRISEKTVARHLSNIFTKLGLSSRAGATAYAYEHHLVGPPA